jgi:hypothetical protein
VIHRDRMLCSCLQTQALHVKSHETFFRSGFFLVLECGVGS